MLTELVIDIDLPEQEMAFLSQHYQITENANWKLTNEYDNYKIIGKFENSEFLELVIDFRVGKYRHRGLTSSKEPLLNAIKVKGKPPSCVLDATPGCLKDGYLMASRNIKVIAIERSPIMFFLLNNALAKVNSFLEKPIELIFADSVDILKNKIWINERNIDLIYLDPIYPDKKKSALVKKEMRITKALVGDDLDSNDLFNSAISLKKRIIVKRPPYAEPINNSNPSFISQTGKTRFDVYV